MKKTIKMLSAFLVLITLILSTQYWLVWMNNEIIENSYIISKILLETDYYKIWYNINNNLLIIIDGKCINGVITWIIQHWNEIYFSVNIERKMGTQEYLWNTSNVFFYSLYKNTPSKMVELEKDIPQFWLLTNSGIIFYSRDSLKTLPIKKQEQFIDIFNNHHFIFQ